MSRSEANLVLIGLRGAGKSTIGRLAAQHLARTFIDLDDRTAARLAAVSAAEALSRHGLAAFRDAEFDALRETLADRGLVVALGGGTPTAPGAADFLTAERLGGRAVVVYLRALPNALRRRLAADDAAARPSLTGRGTLEEVDELFDQRDPLYQKLADAIIDAADAPVEQLVRRVASLV